MTKEPNGIIKFLQVIGVVLLGYAVGGIWWGATISANQVNLKTTHEKDITELHENIKEIKVRQQVFDGRQIEQGQLLVEIKTLIKRNGNNDG